MWATAGAAAEDVAAKIGTRGHRRSQSSNGPARQHIAVAEGVAGTSGVRKVES